MILIIGGAVEEHELPHPNIIDYKIDKEYNRMRVDLLVKSGNCDAVYVHMDLVDSLSTEVEDKSITFSSQQELVNYLERGTTEDRVIAPIIMQPQQSVTPTTQPIEVQPVSEIEVSVPPVGMQPIFAQPESQPIEIHPQEEEFDKLQKQLDSQKEEELKANGQQRVGGFIFDTSVTPTEYVPTEQERELEQQLKLAKQSLEAAMADIEKYKVLVKNKDRVYQDTLAKQRIKSEGTIGQANENIRELNNRVKELSNELARNPVKIYSSNPQAKIIPLRGFHDMENVSYFAMGGEDSFNAYYSSIITKMQVEKGNIYIDLTCNRYLARIFKSVKSNNVLYLAGGDIRSVGQEVEGNIYVASAYMNDVALLDLPIQEIIKHVESVYPQSKIILLLGTVTSFISNSLIVELQDGGSKGHIILECGSSQLLTVSQYLNFLSTTKPEILVTNYHQDYEEVLTRLHNVTPCYAFTQAIVWDKF